MDSKTEFDPTRALETFRRSPFGERFREVPDRDLLVVLLPTIAIAAGLARLPPKPSPYVVRVLFDEPMMCLDDGRWLDPTLVGGPRVDLQVVYEHDAVRDRRRSRLHAYVLNRPAPRQRSGSEGVILPYCDGADFILDRLDRLLPPLGDATREAYDEAVRAGKLAYFSAVNRVLMRTALSLEKQGVLCDHAFITVDVGREFSSPAEDFLLLIPSSTQQPQGSAIGHGDPRAMQENDDLSCRLIRGDDGQLTGIEIDETTMLTVDGEVRERTSGKRLEDAAPPPVLTSVGTLARLAEALNAIASTRTADVTLPDGRVITAPSPDAPENSHAHLVNLGAPAVKRWFQSGGSVNSRDALGRTLLHYAVLRLSASKAAEWLLRIGADPDLPDKHGWTPLAYAVALDKPGIVITLLDAGASIDVAVEPGVRVQHLIEARARAAIDADEPASEAAQSLLASAAKIESAQTEQTPDVANPLAGLAQNALAAALAQATKAQSVASEARIDPPSETPNVEPAPREVSATALETSETHQSFQTPTVEPSAPRRSEAPVQTPAVSYAPADIEPPRPSLAPAVRDRGDVVPIIAWPVAFPPSVSAEGLRRKVVAWMSDRLKERLDPDDPHFESSTGSVVADLSDSGLWAMRWDNTATPGVIFRVEAVIVPEASGPHFGLRVHAIRQPGSDVEIGLSIPGVLGRLVALGATDMSLQLGTVRLARTRADGEAVLTMLLSTGRNLPLVVVTARKGVYEEFPEKLLPLAHVVQVEGEALDVMREALGRERITWGGGWRAYRPGYEVSDEPSRSPYLLPDAELHSGRRATRLRRMLWRVSGESVASEDHVPGFLTARRIILQQAKSARRQLPALPLPATPSPTAPSTNDQTEALTRRVSELIGALAKAEDDSKVWQSIADDQDTQIGALRSECGDLRRRLYAAQQQLSWMRSVRPDTKEAAQIYPEGFEDLARWVDEHLEGNVYLTAKAVRSARASRLDPDVVEQAYAALDVLANEYLDAKSGETDARTRLSERLQSLRLEVSKVGTALNNHRYADEYMATVDGKRYLLDMHVSGSSVMDPRRCLRIYFAFDPEGHRVIVGHLPTHLSSTHT